MAEQLAAEGIVSGAMVARMPAAMLVDSTGWSEERARNMIELAGRQEEARRRLAMQCEAASGVERAAKPQNPFGKAAEVIDLCSSDEEGPPAQVTPALVRQYRQGGGILNLLQKKDDAVVKQMDFTGNDENAD